MQHEVIIPTGEVISPWASIWAKMPPLLSLTAICSTLIGHMYNPDHQGGSVLSELPPVQSAGMAVLMEAHLPPLDLKAVLANADLWAELNQIVPPLWERLAMLSPMIVNSVQGDSVVKGVTHVGWRGGDMLLMVTTGAPSACYAAHHAV